MELGAIEKTPENLIKKIQGDLGPFRKGTLAKFSEQMFRNHLAFLGEDMLTGDRGMGKVGLGHIATFCGTLIDCL